MNKRNLPLAFMQPKALIVKQVTMLLMLNLLKMVVKAQTAVKVKIAVKVNKNRRASTRVSQDSKYRS